MRDRRVRGPDELVALDTTVARDRARAARPPLPLLPDVGVVALVPDSWDSLWQTRHYVLARLARYFHVAWCNPSAARGARTERADDLVAVDDPTADRAIPPGLHVYRPPAWIPPFHRWGFPARLAFRGRLRGALRHLAKQGSETIVLSLWRPSYAPALDLLPHTVSCYHIDDEYTFAEVEQKTDEQEARLIRDVDQVFVTSPALLEKKGPLNPRTLLVPNGVDYRTYVRPCPEPADLQAIPRPRIGYVGVIKKQLDLELLDALARRHPQWSFVLVGPHRHLHDIGVWLEKLAALPNVHFLGEKPVSALPGYTQHMDVCMLCYKVDGYTQFIYPLKLHESLASGRPCVGSPIRTLREFASVLSLAGTPDEWSRALAGTLTPAASSPSRSAARREVARQHDWDWLVYRIARELGERLGPAYVKRIDAGMPDSPAQPRPPC